MGEGGDRSDEDGGFGGEGEGALERWILPYVREPTLWPVLVVVLAHAMAFLGPLLLLALRDGSRAAVAAAALLALGSAATVRFEIRSRQRPGAISALLLVSWLGSGAAALVADRLALF